MHAISANICRGLKCFVLVSLLHLCSTNTGRMWKASLQLLRLPISVYIYVRTHFKQAGMCLINNQTSPEHKSPSSQAQERGTKKGTLYLKICDVNIWPFHISLSSNTWKCQGQTIRPVRNSVFKYAVCVCMPLHLCNNLHRLHTVAFFCWVSCSDGLGFVFVGI